MKSEHRVEREDWQELEAGSQKQEYKSCTTQATLRYLCHCYWKGLRGGMKKDSRRKRELLMRELVTTSPQFTVYMAGLQFFYPSSLDL
jgi:hypothetical protein